MVRRKYYGRKRSNGEQRMKERLYVAEEREGQMGSVGQKENENRKKVRYTEEQR